MKPNESKTNKINARKPDLLTETRLPIICYCVTIPCAELTVSSNGSAVVKGSALAWSTAPVKLSVAERRVFPSITSCCPTWLALGVASI